MVRRLVLVRHASTADGSPDIARPLAEDGRGDAAAIGRWLAENDVVPDLVVVSPARRAQQTWDLAAAHLATHPPTRIDGRIYDNTVDDVLDVVRETPDDVTTLVVVGHNPSLGALAGAGRFPTSAIALVGVDRPWVEFETSRPMQVFTAH